jgi:PAS domain S-box-containing protein
MRHARSFTAEPQSVGAARRFAAESVRELPERERETVTLLVSELATNSIRHAGSGFSVCIEGSDAAVRVAVKDTGGGHPRLRSPAPDEVSGRGLKIVEMLADEWGVEALPGSGKVVWFRTADPVARELLRGGGEVGWDLLAVDWAATPLGPVRGWPRSLRTVVQMLLRSRFAMWMAWGPELTFLCNDAYRRDTLGHKYPWALGRSAREVWAEIWPEIGPRIEHVLASGEATWDEALMLFLERSGYREETYHTFSYSPLSDDEDRVAGMLCVVSEDTERVIAERRMALLRDLGAVSAAARDERAYLREAARALAHEPRLLPFTLVYLLDGQGGAQLAATSGIEPGAPGAPREIPPGAAAPAWPLDPAAHEPTLVQRLSERFGPLPGGAWPEPPEWALVVPLAQAAQPRPYGFLVAALNRYRALDEDYRSFIALAAGHLAAGIAAARSFEAERRRAEQLAELDRAKTAFFSNVSHEFRTPLTLILAPLGEALSDPRGMPPAQAQLVHRNALRLLKLVNSLLDFSRLQEDRAGARFQPVALCELTRELAGTFEDAARRAGLELRIDCEPLPEPVYVDPELYEQIVLNLLSNAFKATQRGHIEVTLRPAGGEVELAVEDTGTGIPPEELPRLFSRFHRVRGSLGRSHEGSGIGLALVRELAELHGGRVAVRSALGAGSRFTVTLPLGTEHLPSDQVEEAAPLPGPQVAELYVNEVLGWLPDPSEPPPAPAPAPGAADGEGEPATAALPRSGARVLVADDNRDLRRYLSRLLAREFEVEAVADGREALERIRAAPPELVIADVMMPGLDGYRLLAELRAAPQTRELPVILLSARAGEEAAVEGLGAGADDYLAKPFSGRELLARARAHVELGRLRRRAAAELRAQRLQLEQILQQLPVGVVIAEAPSGRIVLVNEQAAAIVGRRPREDETALDYPTPQLGPLEGGEPPPRPLLRALREGEVTSGLDLRRRDRHGRWRTVRVSAAPIREESGAAFAAVAVLQDVTEHLRDQMLLEVQRDTLEMIAAGQPLSRTLESLVVRLEQGASRGTHVSVMLFDRACGCLRHGAAPSLPAAFNAAVDGLFVGPRAGSCGTAVHRGEPVVVADTLADPLWEEFRELAREHGLRACWSLPLRSTDGEIVGTFAVYHDRPREPTPAERGVAELMARTAAVAIARARDAEARNRQLRELQSSLLPRSLPAVPGLELAVSFHPGDRGLEVGGDFYDLFGLADGAWGVVVGDVCGHGAAAAAVTALARHTTRAIARLAPSPAGVLAIVNDALRAADYDRYCTAVYARLEAGDGGFTLRLSCGGHPPPLIRRATGEVEVLDRHGPLIGVLAAPRFPELVRTLALGDTLLLYTDGLIERNPLIDGDRGLAELMCSLEFDGARALVSELDRRRPAAGRRGARDDVAILALHVR